MYFVNDIGSTLPSKLFTCFPLALLFLWTEQYVITCALSYSETRNAPNYPLFRERVLGSFSVLSFNGMRCMPVTLLNFCKFLSTCTFFWTLVWSIVVDLTRIYAAISFYCACYHFPFLLLLIITPISLAFSMSSDNLPLGGHPVHVHNIVPLIAKASASVATNQKNYFSWLKSVITTTEHFTPPGTLHKRCFWVIL